MIFDAKSLLCAAFAVALAFSAGQAQAAESKAQPAGETTLEIKAKLDVFAKNYLARANASITPNRNQVSVKKVDDGYVAVFREADLDSMTTEIYPSKRAKCDYVGHVVYLEKEYESVGETKDAAQNGEFKPMRARRMRELFRYERNEWRY